MGRTQKIIICVLIAVVFAAGGAVTTYLIMQHGSENELFVAGNRYERLMKFFELDDIADLIDEHYYKEVHTDELIDGALTGFIEDLGDGYSKYYPEEYFKYFDVNTEGSYIGQGMLISKDEDTGYVLVKRVFADTPADEQNIAPGNLIKSIDGMDTRLMDKESAVSCLRGGDGTEITLDISAGDRDMEIKFVRRTPNSQVVFSDVLDNGIGYIDIAEFSGSSVADFKEAVKTVMDENVKAVIIDLRDNPGGYISQAAEIADMLLDEGDICYTLNRTGERAVTSASAGKSLDIPIAVLINKDTEGAAEVFAAALKDNGAARLIGVTTRGKGVVLMTIQVPNSGDGIRLVTGHYYSPKGNPINEKGVSPDETVVMSGAVMSAEEDTQLQKAIEILNG